LKCNVDASFYEDLGHRGGGCCVRNAKGRFVAAGTNLIRQNLATIKGEAMAILDALREAIARGWTNIVFESGSKCRNISLEIVYLFLCICFRLTITDTLFYGCFLKVNS
jgi:hypothetical protein